jgi:hypothetical protein
MVRWMASVLRGRSGGASLSARARRLALAVVGLVLLVAVAPAGCLSPTLPLPPPSEPESMQPGADGVWEIRGECTPGALVTVFNTSTGRSAGVEDRDATGRYRVSLEASRCHGAWITEQLGTEVTPQTVFVIREQENGVPADSSSCR